MAFEKLWAILLIKFAAKISDTAAVSYNKTYDMISL